MVVRLVVAVVILLSASLGACARGEVLPKPASTSSPIVRSCPLGVPLTRVDVADTSAGVDVLLTTDDRHMSDLRARIQNQARVHGADSRTGPGHFGRHGYGHDHGLKLWQIEGIEVSAEDVPSGGVVHVKVKDEARLDAVRARLRSRVAYLDLQRCPYGP